MDGSAHPQSHAQNLQTQGQISTIWFVQFHQHLQTQIQISAVKMFKFPTFKQWCFLCPPDQRNRLKSEKDMHEANKGQKG